MKTLVATFSVSLLVLIALPLGVSLLVSVPAVQNAIVHRFTDFASEKLGTRVNIGSVRVKLINHIEINDFLVEDLAGDTLLHASKVSVPVVEWGLGGGELTFGRVKVDGAEMWLRRDSTGVLNIRQTIDAMRGGKPQNPDSKFRMRIMGVEGRGITFGLRFDDRSPKDEGVDFSRFVIRNATADIDDLVVARDTVRMDIRSASLDERSGMRVDDLSVNGLTVSRGAVRLDNVRARAEGSEIDAPLVLLDAGKKDWTLFQDFNDNVSFDVRVRPSRVTTDLLGWFAPVFANRGLVFDDVEAHAEGPLSALSGAIANLTSGDTALAAEFSSTGLPDVSRMRLKVENLNVKTSGDEVERLIRTATGNGLPEGIAAPVGRLGEIALKGSASGGMDGFDAYAVLSSDTGIADVTGKISLASGTTSFDGNLTTAGFDVGNVLAINEMGSMAGSVAARGAFAGGKLAEGSVEGRIDRFDFRGHPYSGITVRGSSDGNTYRASLAARDRALDADLTGSFETFSGDVSRVNLSLDLRHADLAAANLNRIDSISTLSGRLTASVEGSNVDDINGTLEARDLFYTSPHGSVTTPIVTIRSQSTQVGKELSLRSEFADAVFRSRLDYGDMFASLAGFLHDYVPIPSSGVANTTPAPIEGQNPFDITGYSAMNVTLKNTDALLGALAPGIRIAAGSALSATFNPYIRTFSLSARFAQLQYRGVVASEVELSSNNASDSLVMHLAAGDIYSQTAHIPDFVLHGGAKGRQMELSTRFTEENGGFAGVLGVRVSSDERPLLSEDGALLAYREGVEDGGGGEGGEDEGDEDRNSGGADLRVQLLPSHFSIDRTTWRVASGSLLWRQGRTSIDNLRIVSTGNSGVSAGNNATNANGDERGEGRQRLTASGAISKSGADVLHVELRNFDLSPLEKLVGKGMALRGVATGNIDAGALTGEPRIDARVDLDGVSMAGIEAPPLALSAVWDERMERILFEMLDRRAGMRVVSGSVSPADRTLDAAVTIDSLDVAVLDPLLGGILEQTRGKASVRLKAEGTFDRVALSGGVSVPRLETTLGFTRARYTLEGAEFAIKDSRLSLPATPLRDAFGGDGTLAMSVDARDLGNPRITIDASTRGMLVFDTEAAEGAAFYGRVFATGSAAVRYDRMGTAIDISARTDRGTRFFLPLNAKSNASWADFVTFVDPRNKEIDRNDALARARLRYEKQREAPTPERRKPLGMSITAELTPEAELHLQLDPSLGNGITAHGAGVIGLEVNPSAGQLTMTGDYTISQGRFEFSMADVFSKDFDIVPGSSLRWSGAPEDALLNIRTSHRVRTSLVPLLGEENGFGTGRSSMPVDCILSLSGPMSAPEITFDIDLPSADRDAKLAAAGSMNTPELKSMQFLSLLMTGSFVTDNSITGQTAGSGAMATGALGFDILTNQLGNFLSSDDYDIYFRYRPQENFLSNQFDVGFSTGILDNTLLLEIEGNYVDDRAITSVGTNASNLAGDVSLTWVIDRAGNLRLKVFTKTIDRLNETQGLQESGLGVSWKKDFNRAGDIFKRKNSNFGEINSDKSSETGQ
ncbi:MAG: translocation/assembly module TamB [Alistipes sp.]|nr:translocation/assembly module TamB [Alistipes sp.]